MQGVHLSLHIMILTNESTLRKLNSNERASISSTQWNFPKHSKSVKEVLQKTRRSNFWQHHWSAIVILFCTWSWRRIKFQLHISYSTMDQETMLQLDLGQLNLYCPMYIHRLLSHSAPDVKACQPHKTFWTEVSHSVTCIDCLSVKDQKCHYWTYSDSQVCYWM